MSQLWSLITRELRKTLESNQIPEGTSRLAGGPYRHQGLSSVVLIIGLEPITSDVSDRRSHQLSYMSGCGQGRTRTFNHSINSRGLCHWATCPIGGSRWNWTTKTMFYRHDQDPADTPFCTLYRDRTCDLLYVRQPLLPSELRVLIVSPTGFEPVTPSLKVRCSKTSWATKTLSKWQGSNLRPDGPKPPALPSELHLVVEERAGFEPADPWRSPVFKTGAINQLYHLSLLLFPKGSNLNSMDQNHVSCQLDEGTIMKPICQRTFLSSVPESNWFLLITSQAHRHQCLQSQYKTKKPEILVSGFTFLLLCC